MRLIYALICLAVVVGCRTTCDKGSESSTATNHVSVVSVQYVASVGNAGMETVEVVLRNSSTEPVLFVKAELDGTELPPIDPTAQKALSVFNFGIGGTRGKRKVPVAVSGVRWWQFYPSPLIPAGGHAAFQFNFAERSRPCDLVLATSKGLRVPVRIPRYSKPKRRIEYLAFTGDGAMMTLRYSKGTPPSSVSLNGIPLAGFRDLGSTGPGRPGAFAVSLPRLIKEGDSAFVELEFPDGVRCSAFIRAMLGVCTVAPNGKSDTKPLDENVRNHYGFDPVLRLYRIPHDVACSDKKAGIHGMNAQSAVASRMGYNASNPNGLSGMDFCTGLYPGVWNIYSQIADAVISKPYKFHWGRTPHRFIDEEDEFVEDVVMDVAPRPVIWVPDRFRWTRELDGREFTLQAWSAFMRGARGLRVHHWFNSRNEPFAGNPGLAEAVRTFNSDFNKVRPLLEKSIPMWCHERRDQRVKIYESWCADEGILLFVRNLRYDVGLDAKARERVRPFSVKPIGQCRFTLPRRHWFVPGTATVPVTGEAVLMKDLGDAYEISINNLDSHMLIWISNKGIKDLGKKYVAIDLRKLPCESLWDSSQKFLYLVSYQIRYCESMMASDLK